MKTVTLEIASCGEENRIDVFFPYDAYVVKQMKNISGRSFVKTPTKHWHIPLDLETCRRMRELFGRNLQMGPNLYSWATNMVRMETQLGSLAAAETAELTRLPELLPTLYEAVHLGPKGLQMNEKEKQKALKEPASYQAADIKFLADAVAPLNGNQPGLGKTLEWIGAIYEAGLAEGSHLVVCPATAVDGVWESELFRWQEGTPYEVEIFACLGVKSDRETMLKFFSNSKAESKWVIVNPEMVRYRKDASRKSKLTIAVKGEKAEMTACYCNKGNGPHEHYISAFPILHNTTWTSINIDECHKGSVRNHRTITAKSLNDLKCSGKKSASSGTPMKKRGADIWGTLHYLRPDVFTSYWRFAEDYFRVEDNGYGKVVMELRDESKESFFRMLRPYMLRRTKAEALPWLPLKSYVPVWCHMESSQQKQYAAMERKGASNLIGGTVAVTNVLTEFLRLRQFATALCEIRNDKVIPTSTSCKLDALIEKLEEFDVFDPDNNDKHVIFSQSREVIEWVARELQRRDIRVDILSGAQNKVGERKDIVERFQIGDTQILCVVTTAGGVAITLDAADTAHFIDEMWSPDEMEQAEDRLHRASRMHQVMIYQYRTMGTIDEYIMDTSMNKAAQHNFIMDVRRQLLEKYGL
jgi:Zierdtviridae DNA helicase